MTIKQLKKTKVLVTGGSGSLGTHIIKSLLKKGVKNIVSISRDEGLVKSAETSINSKYVDFRIGDICDTYLVPRILKDVDIVFSTAALKHVSLSEKNPREAYRVNVQALLNLLDNSSNVKRFVHVSSDKAIGVMNCYGATKLLGEYLVKDTNNIFNGEYTVVRCPNFLGSRGSVLDVWKSQIENENKIKITDPMMTRYFISLPEAAEYIIDIAIKNKVKKDFVYYPLKYTQKFQLKDLAEAFVELYGDKKSKIETIGALPGEKQHEDYIKDVKLTSKAQLKKFLADL